MKSKLLALIVAFILAMSAVFVVACDDGQDAPPSPQPPDPEYVTLSLDEFNQAIEGYLSIENIIEVLKYKLDFNIKTEVDSVTTDTEVSAILDFSQLDDVATSVNISNVTVTPPTENATSFVPEETEIEINLYLYSDMLYVDVTADGETLKDSMEVDNDLTQIIMQFMAMSSDEAEIPTDIPQIDEEAMAELQLLMEYFEDYITVTYCSELGHYVLDLDYSLGGVYEGENIDPFAFTVEFYVKNGRITSVEFDFVSLEIKFNGAFSEHSGSIVYPQNTSEYNSILFELIEEMFMSGSLS